MQESFNRAITVLVKQRSTEHGAWRNRKTKILYDKLVYYHLKQSLYLISEPPREDHSKRGVDFAGPLQGQKE